MHGTLIQYDSAALKHFFDTWISRWQLWRWPRSKFHWKLPSFCFSWICSLEKKGKISMLQKNKCSAPPLQRMSRPVCCRLTSWAILENFVNSAARFRLTEWIDHSINPRNWPWGKIFYFFSRCAQTLRHLGLRTPLNLCPAVMNCSIPPKNSKKCQQN